MAEERGSIAFSATYRPPEPLNIFSLPLPLPLRLPSTTLERDEFPMTDVDSYEYNGQDIPPGLTRTNIDHYNYNGQDIPSPALKTIIKHPKFASKYKEADVNSGHRRLSGMVFVSERGSLETLHIALRFIDDNPPEVEVFNFADTFGTFNGVRMEDTGCLAGDYLIYVTTKDPAKSRQPWTAVYKTNLKTGKTDRLTPSGSFPHSFTTTTTTTTT